MNYIAYELAHAFITPLRFMSTATRLALENPWNPLSLAPFAKSTTAALQVFDDMTKRYGKPSFGIADTVVGGTRIPVREETVLQKPFCNLVHFVRDGAQIVPRRDPRVLVVAPMSGHYATLLRGTVAAMLPEHDVFITDWKDARVVPLADGQFDLDTYIDYTIEMIDALGPNTHVIAVCQPAVPVLAAVALMASRNMANQPASMTLMGGPIDPRRNPTAVNKHAVEKSLSWFEGNVMSYVPFPHAGFMRRVYPGFIQLGGFMSMNYERHQTAFRELFENLVQGDCDSVQQHRKFYDEYLAVMDLPAEFFLQTVKSVFQDHDLPQGRMMHRGERVDPTAIKRTALLTIEGEKDDICGIGQTEAAHDLCSSIPADEKFHYMQPGVGHYGVFNGTRFRTEIQPRIRDVIRSIQRKRSITPSPLSTASPAADERAMQPYAVPGAVRAVPAGWDAAQPSGKPN
ncbi:MAG: polyhydroxyalkanoate depolymerase [Hyphomicrobiaceae bacterium]|nr:polyhydroxyalkanoate depolymerase [Hyphomicrobiaceae bacterium]